MRYMLLIYDAESRWNSMSEQEKGQLYHEYMTFTDQIKKSGHHLAGDPLQPIATATTVRVRNGKTATTDGPLAETKEQLGGYYIAEAYRRALELVGNDAERRFLETELAKLPPHPRPLPPEGGEGNRRP